MQITFLPFFCMSLSQLYAINRFFSGVYLRSASVHVWSLAAPLLYALFPFSRPSKRSDLISVIAAAAAMFSSLPQNGGGKKRGSIRSRKGRANRETFRQLANCSVNTQHKDKEGEKAEGRMEGPKNQPFSASWSTQIIL